MKPRAKCHPEKPHEAHGFCKNCYKQHRLKTEPTFAERLRFLRNKRYQERKSPIQLLKWRIKNFNCAYKPTHITIEQYQQLLEQQDNKCAICQQSIQNEQIHIDHSHVSHIIRGLLCPTCNRGIGLFKDNPKHLLTAASYLKSYIENSCLRGIKEV